MAVTLQGGAIPLTVAIPLWLSVATALPATAQPKGPSTMDRGRCQAVVTTPGRNACIELTRRGFAIGAVGNRAITAIVDASGPAQWIPTSPGSRVLRVLAADTGKNMGMSQPLTFIAQASL
jgi:hypothetical protein